MIRDLNDDHVHPQTWCPTPRISPAAAYKTNILVYDLQPFVKALPVAQPHPQLLVGYDIARQQAASVSAKTQLV